MIKQITSSEPLIGFVPQAIAADENPRLAGFPANVLYAGRRDESGFPYAIYFPDPATFAEDELSRQMFGCEWRCIEVARLKPLSTAGKG